MRLLTLTGPPGVGKTRLAVELAASVLSEFDDGVRFVDLSPVADARLVMDAISRQLGLREFGGRRPTEVVEEFLRDKSVLLILDNFEQVLDAAADIGRLLAACADVKVLVTSRAPLHLRWESELPVAALRLPDLDSGPACEAVATSPAGQLFLERARAVVPSLALSEADAVAVADICLHLDGLPLGIELAAARIQLFPPRALLRRLVSTERDEDPQELPLRLLASEAPDLPARQQTLLQAVAWSFDLLDSDEQAVLRRLSVFVGGCTLEAAEAVAGGVDVIASLVDKSLLWRDEQADGEPRLRMLETIRAYARAQLGAGGEVEAVLTRHAEYFVDLASVRSLSLSGATSTRGSRDWNANAATSWRSSVGPWRGRTPTSFCGWLLRCGQCGWLAATLSRRALVYKRSCHWRTKRHRRQLWRAASTRQACLPSGWATTRCVDLCSRKALQLHVE